MSAPLRQLLHRLRSNRSTDAELVGAYVAGRDEGAFAELVRRHGPMVLATCRRAPHPDVHAADDAFQAAFLVLATKAGTIRPPGHVGAWLHGVAVHVARRARAWVGRLATADRASLDGLAAAPGPDPDLREAIDGALAALPEKYRAPVVLCDLEGRPRAEAAAALGWTEGTLSGRLARARRLLADRLARRGVTLPAGLAMVLPALPAALPPDLTASVLKTASLTAGAPAPIVALAEGVPHVSRLPLKFLVAGLAAVSLSLAALGLTPPAPPKQPAAPSRPAVAEQAPGPPQWEAGASFTHRGTITALAFAPSVVAAGDDQGYLVLWDATTGKHKETLSTGTDGGGQVSVDGLQISPDGSRLFKVLNRGGAMHQATLRKEGRDWSGFGDSGERVYYGVTGGARRWLARGAKSQELLLLRNARGKFEERVEARFAHKDRVTHAAGHGDVIASVAGLERPVLRRWQPGKAKPVWEAGLGQMEVTALLVSPGGKRVAVAGDGGQLRAFDAANGKLVSRAAGMSGVVRAAAFSPDGKRIVAGCRDGSARVFDAESGKALAVLKGHRQAVTAVAFGPDGVIATGSADRTGKVWRPRR